MNISLIGNSALRIAIQRNLVSFPSQIPGFTKRPGDDTLQRVAHLYFGRGWPVRDICARYGLSKTMAQRLISEWRIRAVGSGYIQAIHPEDLDVLINVKDDAEWPHPLESVAPPQEVQLLRPGSHAMFSHTTV